MDAGVRLQQKSKRSLIDTGTILIYDSHMNTENLKILKDAISNNRANFNMEWTMTQDGDIVYSHEYDKVAQIRAYAPNTAACIIGRAYLLSGSADASTYRTASNWLDLDFETISWLFYGEFSRKGTKASVNGAMYALDFLLSGGDIKNWVLID